MAIKNKLKIVCLGYDWNGIGRADYQPTKMKLDRDGLNIAQNDFLMVFSGFTNKREKIKGENIFLVWHVYLANKIKIIYDLLLILLLPLILVIEKFKPDVFYLYDFFHIFISYIPAKICGSKIYLRLINLPRELALSKGQRGSILYVYYQIIEKITYCGVDKFIVINQTTKKYLMDMGVKENKIIFDIPDTIQRDNVLINKASNLTLRKKYHIPADKKIILSVGSLLKEKGFFELINNFAGLKRADLILIICGVGPEELRLQELVKSEGMREQIIFAGKISREEIWEYFKGADLFMLFSKSESLGMVFWEAMYVNLPVIGTPVGGVKETIGDDGERGFYWKDDLNDLNEKIDFCLRESEAKKRMLTEAKNFVTTKLKIKNNINSVYDAG